MMDHFPKPTNKTDEELRQVAAILTMIATAIARMADATPDVSHNDRQNKKAVGASTPASNSLPEHEILTVADVAKYLRISRSQAYALTRRGDIQTIHVGQSPRVRRQDLLNWIEDRMRDK